MADGRERRTKCTPARRKAIVELIRKGVPISHAAVATGVSHTAVYEWLAKGRAGGRSIYREFNESVKRAEAESVVELVGRVAEAGRKDWRAVTWLLTRRAPAEFMDPGKRAELMAAQARAEVARAEADQRVKYIEHRAKLLEADE